MSDETEELDEQPVEVLLKLRPYEYHMLISELMYPLRVINRDSSDARYLLKLIAKQGGVTLHLPEHPKPAAPEPIPERELSWLDKMIRKLRLK